MSEEKEFGKVDCDLSEYPGVWVKFKTRGYPFKLRQQWRDAKDDAEIASITLRYIEAWGLVDIDGKDVPLPATKDRPYDLLADVEDALVVWMVREFKKFWQFDLVSARPNS